MRPVSVRRLAEQPVRPVHRVEYTPDLVLYELPEAFTATRAGEDGRDNPPGGGHANVGGNQQLLERLDRIDVDLAGARRPSVGTLHDLVETTDELLFGATQALAQPVKKRHIPSGPLPLSRLGALRPQH